MTDRNEERVPAGNAKGKPSHTFTAPFIRPQLIARLTRTLVTAQGVQTSLLAASTVRLGTLVFLYKDGKS